jgi:hypothetical protein
MLSVAEEKGTSPLPPHPTHRSRRVPASQFPSRFALVLLCDKSEKLTSLFSNHCALFQKEYFNNSFSINHLHTLLQNTGVYTPQDTSVFSASLRPSIAIPFRIRTYAKTARNPFRMRTSKRKDLKLFRINTYKKTGRGAPCNPLVYGGTANPVCPLFSAICLSSSPCRTAPSPSLRYPYSRLHSRRRFSTSCTQPERLSCLWLLAVSCQLSSIACRLPHHPPVAPPSNGCYIASHTEGLTSKNSATPADRADLC